MALPGRGRGLMRVEFVFADYLAKRIARSDDTGTAVCTTLPSLSRLEFESATADAFDSTTATGT